jgi:hypothetical protein
MKLKSEFFSRKSKERLDDTCGYCKAHYSLNFKGRKVWNGPEQDNFARYWKKTRREKELVRNRKEGTEDVSPIDPYTCKMETVQEEFIFSCSPSTMQKY